MCRVVLRSGGTAVAVAFHTRLSLLVGLTPVATPTKFPDGSVPFWKVSNATAMPGIPDQPRPPPDTPSEVGLAPAVGFPRARVKPSAPVPESIAASNDTSREDA